MRNRKGIGDFPHPVLTEWSSDYKNASFESWADCKTNGTVFKLTAGYKMECPDIEKQLNEGDAAAILHVECPTTRFRQIYDFHSDCEITVDIDGASLDGAVECYVMITAKKEITNYKPDDVNDLMSDFEFKIHPGEIFAISDYIKFNVESPESLERKIGSIFNIVKSEDDSEGYKIDFSTNKILISLDSKTFDKYAELKEDANMAIFLAIGIVIPALVEVLENMYENSEEFQGLKWWKVIDKKLKDKKIDISKSSVVKVNQLFDNPYKRAVNKLEEIQKRIDKEAARNED